MSSRKSIQPIDPVDIGGINPRADELVTTEVIGFLDKTNINPSLLTADDPLLEEWKRFVNDIGNSPIMINDEIDTGDSSDYFDDVDLSGLSDDLPKEIAIGEDFFLSNSLWANGFFGKTNIPMAFVEPLIFGTNVIERKCKMMGMEIEFITQNHEFQPESLSNLVNLVK